MRESLGGRGVAVLKGWMGEGPLRRGLAAALQGAREGALRGSQRDERTGWGARAAGIPRCAWGWTRVAFPVDAIRPMMTSAAALMSC